MSAMLATFASAPHATYKANYKTFKIAIKAAGFTGDLGEQRRHRQGDAYAAK